MKNKIIFIIIIFSLLSFSFVSLISANDYIYARNGVVIYQDHMLRTVYKPFMPCGVQRIDFSGNFPSRFNSKIYPKGDGARLYDELSSPGLSQVIKDQNSPVYNTPYNQYDNYQERNYQKRWWMF